MIESNILSSIQESLSKQDIPEPENVAQQEVDEKQQLEIDELKEKVRALQDGNNRETTLFRLRVGLLIALFIIAVVWLLGIFSLVVASGIKQKCIELPDNVMLAMIGSTTLNVIGLLGIGAKWLYPHKK